MADERKMVEGWLRQEIRSNQGSKWRNQSQVGFLVKLKEEAHISNNASNYGYGYSTHFAPEKYQILVAKATEELYPDEAIQLYKRMVERLINTRGRENYQQATGYLTQVKHLYEKQGRESEWNVYITTLRNKNKSLRALKEELENRGF